MGTLNNISVKETLLLPPGQLYEIFSLYLKSIGYKKEIDKD